MREVEAEISVPALDDGDWRRRSLPIDTAPTPLQPDGAASIVRGIPQRIRSAACAAVAATALCLGGLVPLATAQDTTPTEPSPSTEVAPAAPGGPPTITVVTQNLRNYLPMERRVDGELVDSAPKPESEIAPLVRMLAASKPDVIGVCEIGDESQVSDLQARLKAAGVELAHVEWVDAADEERHLALLSRFPIIERHSRTDLTYRIGDIQLPFQRGILDVTVEPAPDYRLRLIGLHLKSKRDVPEADQAAMRRHEAYLVGRHVEDILTEAPETNLLLYGDLNDTRNEAPVREIQGAFGSPRHLRDIQVADADGYRWTYYWRYADIYSRFDFVLASRGLWPEILGDESFIVSAPDWYEASDHRPLVVRVQAADRQIPGGTGNARPSR